jgi:hypothetical protein
MNTKQPGQFTKALALLGALTTCICGISAADEKPAAPAAPSAWGMLGEHRACVIFREYRKTKVGFFVVIVTTKTHGELEVVETTDGYVMCRISSVGDHPVSLVEDHLIS